MGGGGSGPKTHMLKETGATKMALVGTILGRKRRCTVSTAGIGAVRHHLLLLKTNTRQKKTCLRTMDVDAQIMNATWVEHDGGMINTVVRTAPTGLASRIRDHIGLLRTRGTPVGGIRTAVRCGMTGIIPFQMRLVGLQIGITTILLEGQMTRLGIKQVPATCGII